MTRQPTSDSVRVRDFFCLPHTAPHCRLRDTRQLQPTQNSKSLILPVPRAGISILLRLPQSFTPSFPGYVILRKVVLRQRVADLTSDKRILLLLLTKRLDAVYINGGRTLRDKEGRQKKVHEDTAIDGSKCLAANYGCRESTQAANEKLSWENGKFLLR